ncbi:uncharacterized protein LOC27207363, partial [Drosophila simulans]|uniref:uncharacterized protein LOC27207363 n=1 Tax=Drosophila simulans TaxID=7240 RepID=UPI00192D0835
GLSSFCLRKHIKNKIMNSEDKQNPNYSGEEEDSWTNSYYVCLVCMQTAESPRVSFCGHHFCAKCIYNWIRRQKYQAKCPYCQSLIGDNTLITIRHAKTKENVVSCKSFGELRRKMRMSNDCLSENIFLPEAGMFTRGYIKYPPDPMPRIKPLPPQLLQQWSRYPIVRIFLTPSLHQRFINFAIFLFMLAMYLHAAVTPDLLKWASEV